VGKFTASKWFINVAVGESTFWRTSRLEEDVDKSLIIAEIAKGAVCASCRHQPL